LKQIALAARQILNENALVIPKQRLYISFKWQHDSRK
jgi:hypothetical protein